MVELFTCMGRIEFNELFVHCTPRERERGEQEGWTRQDEDGHGGRIKEEKCRRFKLCLLT